MTENTAKYSSTSLAPEAGFFSTPAISGLISQVVQLVRYGDGLPLIYGAACSGKTTISQVIESRLEQDGFTVKLNAVQFEEDFSGLLLSILGSFGHSSEGSSASNVGDLLSQLRHFSQSLYESKKQAVVIIDDANALDDMSVGALLSLIQGQKPGGFGLHFIFLATKALIERVDALQMLDVAVYDLPVPHLSPSELEEFLLYLNDSSQMTNSEINASSLWSSTGGLLGLVVQQVKPNEHKIPALEPKDIAADSDVTFAWAKSFPVYHIAAIIVLIFILVWVFLFSGSPSPSESVQPVELGATDSHALAADSVSSKENIGSTSVLEQPAQTPSDQKTLSTKVHKQPVYSQFDVAPNKAVIPDTASMPDVKAASEEPELFVSETALDSSVPDNVAVTPAALPSPDKNIAEPVLTLAPESLPSVKAYELPEPERYKSIKNPSLRALLIESESYILAQSPSFFTLQVLAVSKEGALLDFINSQPNKAVLKVYRGVRSGKNFFIVITGAYADKSRARASILDLPLTQRQAKPWVRRYESVKADMLNR